MDQSCLVLINRPNTQKNVHSRHFITSGEQQININVFAQTLPYVYIYRPKNYTCNNYLFTFTNYVDVPVI